ncbi:MAG: hypothetical protein V8R55_02165 [Dysosmobacter sp.]
MVDNQNIAGDGSTVLKVYFKLQFTVTYLPGIKGTFAEQSTGSLDYGAETPAAPDAAKNHAPGYTFAGWNPVWVDTVTDDVTYVAQWTPNTILATRSDTSCRMRTVLIPLRRLIPISTPLRLTPM